MPLSNVFNVGTRRIVALFQTPIGPMKVSVNDSQQNSTIPKVAFEKTPSCQTIEPFNIQIVLIPTINTQL